jgi:hypothetical protein
VKVHWTFANGEIPIGEIPIGELPVTHLDPARHHFRDLTSRKNESSMNTIHF